jgi:phosphate transport system substrate-binding protein
MKSFFYVKMIVLCSVIFFTTCDKNEPIIAGNEYTVYFNSQSGSDVAPQVVKEGAKVVKPDDPIYETFKFLGWYKDPLIESENGWMFDIDVVTSDTMLYAKWMRSHIYVNFDSRGGDEVAQQIIKIGECATEPSPAPTREGHRFDGWYMVGTFQKWDFSQYLQSDITLYARWINDNFVGIKDISFDNYPKVDGSTSSTPLNYIVACKLLGINYTWANNTAEWGIMPNGDEIPEKYSGLRWFRERIQNSQTHGAFINLIDGNTDIILNPRTISPDEKAYADEIGVTLIETPIALDAFVFVVHKNNPVKSLSVEQVQKIYTGEITNWSQVGGNNTEIKVFTRPRNSGSEELFRFLVMKDLEPLDFPESEIASMWGIFPEIFENINSICYTFNTYKEMQVRVPDSHVPKIAINGIFPDKNTIKNSTYPFTAEVYAVIRSDLDRNSMAYKLYEWLQSEEAKLSITESGFITLQ